MFRITMHQYLLVPVHVIEEIMVSSVSAPYRSREVDTTAYLCLCVRICIFI